MASRRVATPKEAGLQAVTSTLRTLSKCPSCGSDAPQRTFCPACTRACCTQCQCCARARPDGDISAVVRSIRALVDLDASLQPLCLLTLPLRPRHRYSLALRLRVRPPAPSVGRTDATAPCGHTGDPSQTAGSPRRSGRRARPSARAIQASEEPLCSAGAAQAALSPEDGEAVSTLLSFRPRVRKRPRAIDSPPVAALHDHTGNRPTDCATPPPLRNAPQLPLAPVANTSLVPPPASVNEVCTSAGPPAVSRDVPPPDRPVLEAPPSRLKKRRKSGSRRARRETRVVAEQSPRQAASPKPSVSSPGSPTAPSAAGVPAASPRDAAVSLRATGKRKRVQSALDLPALPVRRRRVHAVSARPLCDSPLADRAGDAGPMPDQPLPVAGPAVTDAPELALGLPPDNAPGADAIPMRIEHSAGEGLLLDAVERSQDTSATLPPSPDKGLPGLAVVLEDEQSTPVGSSPARRQAGDEASPIGNLENGNRGGVELARGERVVDIEPDPLFIHKSSEAPVVPTPAPSALHEGQASEENADANDGHLSTHDADKQFGSPRILAASYVNRDDHAAETIPTPNATKHLSNKTSTPANSASCRQSPKIEPICKNAPSNQSQEPAMESHASDASPVTTSSMEPSGGKLSGDPSSHGAATTSFDEGAALPTDSSVDHGYAHTAPMSASADILPAPSASPRPHPGACVPPTPDALPASRDPATGSRKAPALQLASDSPGHRAVRPGGPESLPEGTPDIVLDGSAPPADSEPGRQPVGCPAAGRGDARQLGCAKGAGNAGETRVPVNSRKVAGGCVALAAVPAAQLVQGEQVEGRGTGGGGDVALGPAVDNTLGTACATGLEDGTKQAVADECVQGMVVCVVSEGCNEDEFDLVHDLITRLGGEVVSDLDGDRPDCVVSWTTEGSREHPITVCMAVCGRVPVVAPVWVARCFRAGMWLAARPFELAFLHRPSHRLFENIGVLLHDRTDRSKRARRSKSERLVTALRVSGAVLLGDGAHVRPRGLRFCVQLVDGRRKRGGGTGGGQSGAGWFEWEHDEKRGDTLVANMTWLWACIRQGRLVGLEDGPPACGNAITPSTSRHGRAQAAS